MSTTSAQPGVHGAWVLGVHDRSFTGDCWAPSDIHATREGLAQLGYAVTEIEDREYGQTEFFITDDDGFTHCFGVDTKDTAKLGR